MQIQILHQAPPTPVLLHALDLIGCSVFAISGALAAGRKQLDLIGVVVLGLVTAVGGGTIRDVLLDRNPIFWLADPMYVIVIVASALATVAYAHWRHPSAKALLYADAVGLAMFSITGAQIAERAGLPAIAGIVLGTVTGSAGGAVRDVLSAEIPLVLRRGNLYATAAILGTSVYFALTALGAPRVAATWAGMLVIGAARLASIAFQLQLPVFALEGDGVPARRDRTS
ncbi:MAG TPA: trimeric intracellular cation channel family protein [Gemmatimonadaceae bacterium]|nr:trimeric intracellular cation channel family protein [Gemmatimonadaceae bacterium]